MTDSERLKDIIDSSKMSVKAFSEHIGLKSPQNLYDILNGRNGISKKVAESIQAKCVTYNYVWILTGEGAKYKSSVYLDKSFNQEDNSVNNKQEDYNTVDHINKLIDIISSQQQTIDRLTKKKGCNNDIAGTA